MGPDTMRRVVVSRHGGPAVPQGVEADLPEPAAGEVRVKILTAGVSAFDLMYRRSGWLPGSPPVPFALGEDIVGIVDTLGAGVSTLQPGQMVAGGTWVLGVGGGYAESICLPAEELVPVPSGLDPAAAVCLVVNYLTAHLHLHQYGTARRGERLLVHGAAGGVGTAVLELGRLAGLELYGTASRYNHELVSTRGATPIDYRTEDFVGRVRSLTGDGVDIVVDPIGGARQLWRSYRALRRGGRLVWLGAAAAKGRGLLFVGLLSMSMLSLLRRVPDGRTIPATPDLGTFAREHHSWYRQTLTELLEMAAVGALRPVIAKRFPLEAARAHEFLERGGHAGKVMLIAAPWP